MSKRDIRLRTSDSDYVFLYQSESVYRAALEDDPTRHIGIIRHAPGVGWIVYHRSVVISPPQPTKEMAFNHFMNAHERIG